jgi:hypothetical protein
VGGRSWVCGLRKQLTLAVLILQGERDYQAMRTCIRSFAPRRLHEDAIDPVFQDNTDSLYYMTDLSLESTGLPFIVWVSVCAGVQHDVRIWTAPHCPLPSEMTCLAIRPKVRVLKGRMDDDDLALLQRWVGLNLPMILKVWEGEICSPEAIATTRHIEATFSSQIMLPIP